MPKSEAEDLGREPFFSRLFGWMGSKEKVSTEEAEALIREKLANAGSGTLIGCKHIIAIAILHELPMQPSFSIKKIAGLFVDQYKQPGWIPRDIVVLDGIGVESIHRENAGRMSPGESNQILAEKLAAMVKPKAVASCSAITFSGDNAALGHTFFAVVAV
jgi:hypothetical protein